MCGGMRRQWCHSTGFVHCLHALWGKQLSEQASDLLAASNLPARTQLQCHRWCCPLTFLPHLSQPTVFGSKVQLRMDVAYSSQLKEEGGVGCLGTTSLGLLVIRGECP